MPHQAKSDGNHEAAYDSGRINFVISAPTRTEHFETMDNFAVPNDAEPLILVDPAPFTLSPLTSLHKVSMLLERCAYRRFIW